MEPSSRVNAQPGAELRSAAAFVLGFMWAAFVAFYVVFDRYRHLKVADFFLYTGALVAVPIAGYAAFRVLRGVALSAYGRLAFETSALAIAAASTFFRSPTALLLLLAAYLVGVTLAVRARRHGSHGGVSPSSPSSLRAWRWARLGAGLALAAGFARLVSANIATYLYWPYKDYPMVSWAMDITEHRPSPTRILAGAAALVTAIYLCRLAWVAAAKRYARMPALLTWMERHRPAVWIVGASFLAYALLQPDLFPNAHHHNAYLGPRHLMHMGGWPLVDVFSQYGLSYLAFLPLGTILPFNYQSAALIANLFDIAMMLTALAMIYELAGRQRFAIPVAAAFLLVTWLVMPYNLSYTPSVFGVRWLPVWLLVLAFVRQPLSPRLRIGALLLLNLCALWSLETLLVSAIVAAFYRALASRLGGAGLARAVLEAVKVLPLALVGHVIFALLTLVFQGQLPDYATYLEIIGAYRASDNISWFVLASEMILANIWLLFVVVYASLMYLALASFVAGRAMLLEPRLLIGLSVIAAEGIVQGLYFIGRPTHPLLALVGLPLYTILACGLIYWLDALGRRPRALRREAALLATLVPAAFAGGIAVDRAMMEINSGKMGSTNDTMLVKCLRFGECNPARELVRLARELRKPSSLAGDTPEAKKQTDAMVELYRRWQGKAPEIISLAAQRTTAYIELGVRDRLPINNFFNDRLSPTLMDRMAASLETLPAGSLVITIDDMTDYGIGLLCGLNKRFAFVQVDSINETRVERLVERDKSAARNVGAAVERRDGRVFLPDADGKLIPARDGLAGFVERTVPEKNNALVSGWAIDETGPGVPASVIITIRDRVWTTGTPRIERKDIAGLNPAYLKSGFRVLVCDVSPADLATLRAYAVLSDGSARELMYSAGVKHGPKMN